jgi:hypothetical protein
MRRHTRETECGTMMERSRMIGLRSRMVGACLRLTTPCSGVKDGR